MFYSLTLYLICSGLLLFFDKQWDAFYQTSMLLHLVLGMVFVPLCFVFIFRHIKERVSLRFTSLLFIFSSFFAFASLAANFPVVTLLFLMILLVVSYRIYKTSFSEQDAYRKKLLVTGPVALFFLGLIIASGLLIFIGSAAYPGGRLLNVVHGYAGMIFTVLLLLHLALRKIQARKLQMPFVLAEKKTIRRTFSLTLKLFCVTFILALFYWMDTTSMPREEKSLQDVYGSEFFQLTNARTKDNKIQSASMIADSKSCGGFGCHKEIYEQWQSSAHRYGGTSPFFVKTAELMMREKGEQWKVLCAGCHTPAALLSGKGEDAMFQEGVSCLSCHFMTEASIHGNGSYVFSPPEKKYLYQNSGIPGWRGSLSCFLIRLKSSLHREQMAGKEKGINIRKEVLKFRPDLSKEKIGKAFFKTPEFCAPCHKVILPRAFNGVRDIPILEPGISWEAGPYGRLNSEKMFITCNDCHMPKLVKNYYGDMLKDHRFPGANTAVPYVTGDTDMLSFMTDWLEGKILLPDVHDKIPQGTILSLAINAVKNKAGMEIKIRTKNTGDGHVFPVGPLDLLRVWLDVNVRDENGKLVYHNIRKAQNGKANDSHDALHPYLGAKILNAKGNIIDHHRIWTTVAAKDKSVLMPGEEKLFTFIVPVNHPSQEFTVDARWLYKKIYDDFFHHITGRKDSAPVVELVHLKTNVVLK